MTRDEAKKLLPVIQAYADGKDVEWKREDGTWGILRKPIFAADVVRYRIKLEPFECFVIKDCDGDLYVRNNKDEAGNVIKYGSHAPYTIHHMREVI